MPTDLRIERYPTVCGGKRCHCFYYFHSKGSVPHRRAPGETAGSTEHTQSTVHGTALHCCSRSSQLEQTHSCIARRWHLPKHLPCCCGNNTMHQLASCYICIGAQCSSTITFSLFKGLSKLPSKTEGTYLISVFAIWLQWCCLQCELRRNVM